MLVFTKGDWAGNDWSTSGCPAGTCPDCMTMNFNYRDTDVKLTDPPSIVVNNNPSEFAEAYWEINSLRVYTAQQQW